MLFATTAIFNLLVIILVQFYYRPHFEKKSRALVLLTLYSYRASHVGDELFANAEAQASAGSIDLLVFTQTIKVDKQFIKIFGFNTHSCIIYPYLKLNKVLARLVLIFLNFQ